MRTPITPKIRDKPEATRNNIEPNDTPVKAVVVVVVGGMGSVPGALVGGLLIGLVVSFGKVLVPGLSMFLVYLVSRIALA